MPRGRGRYSRDRDRDRPFGKYNDLATKPNGRPVGQRDTRPRDTSRGGLDPAGRRVNVSTGSRSIFDGGNFGFETRAGDKGTGVLDRIRGQRAHTGQGGQFGYQPMDGPQPVGGKPPLPPQGTPDTTPGDLNNLEALKKKYGGRWYDFGAPEGQPGWMRAPRINPGGAEAVWHKDYGWQDWNQIAKLGGDYSSLTPQFGDFEQYFGANRPKGTGGGAGAGAGAGGAGGEYPGGENPFLKGLTQPIKFPVGLGTRERQNIFNLGRSQIQGATKGMMGEMSGVMARRGFKGGESGVADTALGQVAAGGQQAQIGLAQGIAAQESQDRFNQRATLAGLNLSRLGAGGELSLGFGNLAARRAEAAANQALAQAGLDWDKLKFGQTFDWQKQMDTYSMFANLLAGLYGQQGEQYGGYYGML